MAVYGYDVLEIEPNTAEDRTSAYSRTLTVFDSKTGKLRVTDRSGRAVVESQGFSWVMNNRTEIEAYRQWLFSRKGAGVPFWIPSWQHDLIMAGDMTPGNVYLSIQKSGYTKFMWASPSRRYLAFALLNGTGARYYRKVIAAAESTSTETLTLDSAPGGVIPAGQCMVSFLMLVRLSVDDPELIWHSRDVAEAVLSFKELPQEVTV